MSGKAVFLVIQILFGHDYKVKEHMKQKCILLLKCVPGYV